MQKETISLLLPSMAEGIFPTVALFIATKMESCTTTCGALTRPLLKSYRPSKTKSKGWPKNQPVYSLLFAIHLRVPLRIITEPVHYPNSQDKCSLKYFFIKNILLSSIGRSHSPVMVLRAGRRGRIGNNTKQIS